MNKILVFFVALVFFGSSLSFVYAVEKPKIDISNSIHNAASEVKNKANGDIDKAKTSVRKEIQKPNVIELKASHGDDKIFNLSFGF